MRAMFAFLSSENSESLDEDRFCLDVVCHSWALPLRLLGLGIRDCQEPADDKRNLYRCTHIALFSRTPPPGNLCESSRL
jgi:hypothetical protein